MPTFVWNFVWIHTVLTSGWVKTFFELFGHVTNNVGHVCDWRSLCSYPYVRIICKIERHSQCGVFLWNVHERLWFDFLFGSCYNISNHGVDLLKGHALVIFSQALCQCIEENCAICTAYRGDLPLGCRVTHKHICILWVQLDSELICKFCLCFYSLHRWSSNAYNQQFADFRWDVPENQAKFAYLVSEGYATPSKTVWMWIICVPTFRIRQQKFSRNIILFRELSMLDPELREVYDCHPCYFFGNLNTLVKQDCLALCETPS